jgi:GDP-L-fucose synthase
VKKLCFLLITCIYPRDAAFLMSEDALLTAPLEYTNEPYAIAKIAGIKMCESYNLQYGTNFISVMPTNLYGKNDNFNLETSHVLPALIRKIHLGKCLQNGDWEKIREDLNKRPIEGVNGNSANNEILSILAKYGVSIENGNTRVEIWGTGAPMREFLWSEDMADATVFVMENVDFKDTYPEGVKEIRNTHINIGTGMDISIKEAVEIIVKTIGYKGEIYFNTSKPDGAMKKLTNVGKLHNLGWKHKVEIEQGSEMLYKWYA